MNSFDVSLFDRHLDISFNTDGFPEKISAPELEKEWEVSDGGVVTTRDPQDAFLVGVRGVTGVLHVPQLTEDFSAASLDISDLLRQELSKLENNYAVRYRWQGDFSGIAEKIAEQYPFIDFSDPIFDNLSAFLRERAEFQRQFNESFFQKLKGKKPGFHDLRMAFQSGVTGFHTDHNFVSRVLTQDRGKTSAYVDSRLTGVLKEDVFRAAEEKSGVPNITKELLEKHGHKIKQCPPNSSLFFKAGGYLSDKFTADDVVRELLVHSVDPSFNPRKENRSIFLVDVRPE